MVHQRYEQTDLKQWKHDDKWSEYCDECNARKTITQKIMI